MKKRHFTEAYSESPKTSKRKSFATIINKFQLLTFMAKLSMKMFLGDLATLLFEQQYKKYNMNIGLQCALA